jgi:hypothetical protein
VFDRETHFRSKVQNLKSPTSAEYDDSAWQVAFDDAPDKSEADKSLLLAALWFAKQSRALRQTLNPGLDALGGRVSVILAVAALNREFLTASQIAMEGMTQAQAKGWIGKLTEASPWTILRGRMRIRQLLRPSTCLW